jgi:uncharacterized cupin superfamily protein
MPRKYEAKPSTAAAARARLAMSRPSCVVDVAAMPGEKRPRYTEAVGVAAVVRSPGAAAGLTRMGVHVRSIEPGFAGTHRHFHTVEEEWSYVLSGTGTVRIGPLRIPVRAGHFVGFPTGPRPHHFLAEGSEPLVLLEGGESRRAEDAGWYPDARKRWRNGAPFEPYEAPPPEQGDERQAVHIDAVTPIEFQHDVEPRARRRMRALHRGTGLTRQAVYWSRVARGDLSTALHTHERTDEWIFVLSGRGLARVGDARFEVGPHDFVGHPAGSAPHVMEAAEDLVYLMGGQIDADDIVDYPEAGLRRVGGRLVSLNG